MANTEKPGIVIYFDDFNPIVDHMDDQKLGFLVRSLIGYAQFGELPSNNSDPAVNIAFGMLKTKIDRDAEKYKETVKKRKYAAYVREASKMEDVVLSYAEWIEAQKTS